MCNDNMELPLIALRGMVFFPKTTVTFDLSRLKSIEALENAMNSGQKIFLSAQKEPSEENIKIEDIYKIGITAKVKQVLRIPGGLVRVLAEGVERCAVDEFIQENPFFIVSAHRLSEKKECKNEVEHEALLKMLHALFEKYSSVSGKMNPDFIMNIISSDDIGYISDALAEKLPFKLKDKQKVLEETDVIKRTMLTAGLLDREIEVLAIQREITSKVKAKIDKNQREYFLREQIKTIQEELGDPDGIIGEIEDYTKKMNSLKLPRYAKERLEKEISRLKKISASSPESTVSRDFIELILELPWNKETKENSDLVRAQNILDKEHYGLKEVKERIVEFLAVRQMSKDVNVPVLCLVGPPGVGKTSVAKSVAHALNRKYARISLGGISDEAEIRGHRKTYVGAMPGRIISCIKQAESANPLILFDEIDKMRNERKGDPAAALLEVLDGEQNFSFRDNYLEIPFDLSKVLFMCTANSLDGVPPALRDRLEIIHLDSYTYNEKLNIAVKYLLPKQLKKHGLKKSHIKIKDDVIADIISGYTREAGVRKLERLIGKICRKTVKAIISDGVKSVAVKKDNLEEFLGSAKFKDDEIAKENIVGAVTGLAWTSVGGDTLTVEAVTMNGKGKFQITGNTGDVMNESAKAALSFIRANSENLGIKDNFHENTDIHIHIPEGATPKDGPSAGITMASAMVSALSGKPVRRDTAMTGEITLRGRVLPIGGLKEKTLAAKRSNIKRIILPAANKPDFNELPQYAKDGLEFIFAESMDDVLKNILCTGENYEC